MTRRPSHLPRHRRAPNAALALLDAAAAQRDRGDRRMMRLLALDARAWLAKTTHSRQLALPL